MTRAASASCAQEINRLHEEVLQQTGKSRACLHGALVAAWQAGRLLLDEQKHVRTTMGAAWGLWLDQNFRGTHRTACNYMRLADSVAEVSVLEGLSLRQAYLRLGIATEPKSRTDSPRVAKLPEHIRLANRLLDALGHCEKAQRKKSGPPVDFRSDLRALYERLRRIFEDRRRDELPGSRAF